MGTFTLALSFVLSFLMTMRSRLAFEFCVDDRSSHSVGKEAAAPKLWGRRDGASTLPFLPLTATCSRQESLPSFAWTSKEGLLAKCLHVLSSCSVLGDPGVAAASGPRLTLAESGLSISRLS